MILELKQLNKLEMGKKKIGERSQEEIGKLYKELQDKICYNRGLVFLEKHLTGEQPMTDEEYKKAEEYSKKLEDRYGIENLGPYPDWDYGFMTGKYATLNWIFGDDWDFAISI